MWLLICNPFAIYGNRFQLMVNCWHSEPQARLSFTQLQYSFKSIVAASSTNTTTNCITVEPSDSYAFVLKSDSVDDSAQNVKETSPGTVHYTNLPSAMWQRAHHNNTVCTNSTILAWTYRCVQHGNFGWTSCIHHYLLRFYSFIIAVCITIGTVYFRLAGIII